MQTCHACVHADSVVIQNFGCHAQCELHLSLNAKASATYAQPSSPRFLADRSTEDWFRIWPMNSFNRCVASRCSCLCVNFCSKAWQDHMLIIVSLGCDFEMLSCLSVNTEHWSAMHTTCAAMSMIQLNQDHIQVAFQCTFSSSGS